MFFTFEIWAKNPSITMKSWPPKNTKNDQFMKQNSYDKKYLNSFFPYILQDIIDFVPIIRGPLRDFSRGYNNNGASVQGVVFYT